MIRIGIDLGGTNIAVGAVNERHEIIARCSVPTGAERPAQAVIADMCAAVEVLGKAKETVSEQEEKEAGRTLTELQHTDMFEQLVANHPQRAERVTELINRHMENFRQEQEPVTEENDYRTNGVVPDDFGINDIV